MILGTDISRWDNDISTPQSIDFPKMLSAGARFTFIKVSQATWLDRDYTINWQNAKNAGIPRGGFHFLDWAIKPETQADFFSGVLANDPGELQPVVDFENYGAVPSNAQAILWAFLQRLEANMGVIPMIYTGYYFWKEKGTLSLGWAKYPLWIAAYANKPMIPAPWTDYKYWQYSETGDGKKFGGEALGMDMDWYNGTQSDFDKEYGLNSGSAVQIDPSPTQHIFRTVMSMTVRNGPGVNYEEVGNIPAGSVVVPIETISYPETWFKLAAKRFVCGNKNGIIYIK
jgi:lysozyme